jgi:hypothetical protein
MKATCAGCGCIGEHGVRVQTYGRSECCCANAPFRTQDPSETEATPATGSLAQPPTAAPPALSTGLDRTFKIGLLLKAADGVLEIIGGRLLLFLKPAQIAHIVRTLTAMSWPKAHTMASPATSCIRPGT